MKYIKFTKDHPAGIKKGRVLGVTAAEQEKFIKAKFAEKSDEKAFLKFKEDHISTGGGAGIDFAKRSKEARLAVNGKPTGKANNQAPRVQTEDEAAEEAKELAEA